MIASDAVAPGTPELDPAERREFLRRFRDIRRRAAVTLEPEWLSGWAGRRCRYGHAWMADDQLDAAGCGSMVVDQFHRTPRIIRADEKILLESNGKGPHRAMRSAA